MGSGSSKCFSASASSHSQEGSMAGRNDAQHGRFSSSVSRPTVASMAASKIEGSAVRKMKCPGVPKYQEEGDPRRRRQYEGGSSSSHSRSTLSAQLKTSRSFRSESLSRGQFRELPNCRPNVNDTRNQSARNTGSFLLPRSKSSSQSAFPSTSVRPKVPGSSSISDTIDHLQAPGASHFLSVKRARCRRVLAGDGDRAEHGACEQENLGSNVHSGNSSQMQRTPLTRRRIQSIPRTANWEGQHECTRNDEVAYHIDNLNLNRSQSLGHQRVLRSSIDDTFHLWQRSSVNGGIPYHCGSRLRDAFTRMSRDQHVNEVPFSYSDESILHREMAEQQRWQMQSQALQHLRGRLENLSRNERAISCRRSERNVRNSPSTSISRIIMLAEALFEVLDELHSQNETLSARFHGHSPRSLPAPGHVVKSFPTEVHKKDGDTGGTEVSQCYVCLMEYEEGDIMRLLPCQHKFHQLCIDKWLKEVHRVCPLCRGDVCSGSISRKS